MLIEHPPFPSLCSSYQSDLIQTCIGGVTSGSTNSIEMGLTCDDGNCGDYNNRNLSRSVFVCLHVLLLLVSFLVESLLLIRPSLLGLMSEI